MQIAKKGPANIFFLTEKTFIFARSSFDNFPRDKKEFAFQTIVKFKSEFYLVKSWITFSSAILTIDELWRKQEIEKLARSNNGQKRAQIRAKWKRFKSNQVCSHWNGEEIISREMLGFE